MSERLREWRREHGLTQAQLARALSVDAISVSRWERGAQEPPEGMLELALAELGRRLRAESSGEGEADDHGDGHGEEDRTQARQ